MSERQVYGIDLGTTYSCIAHVDEHGKPVVLQNDEGEATTPSVVFFESADNVVVGRPAKELVSIHPDRCVSTIKRSMGDPNWQREICGRTYKPQDVSSFILRKLATDAERITGEKVEDVVITCPAYFGLNEKEATRQAGTLAGLNVLYVIPEPTAAALAYGLEQTQEQVILVYDLGGGTFDVTLIAIDATEITVVCTGGDHQLGGKNWDEAIVDFFVQRFAEETGVPVDSLLEDPETFQELFTAAERCKKNLTTRQSTVEAVRFGPDRVNVELTRETFDRITSRHLEQTLSLTDIELAAARAKGYERIDKLLLVGGSTFMPQVVDAVKKRFPFEVRQFDPNQAVAKGAALYGYRCRLHEEIKIRVAELTGQRQEDVIAGKVGAADLDRARRQVAQSHGMTDQALQAVLAKNITNITSKSFGVVVINGQQREVVANLIERDDAVPKTATRRYGTVGEGQVQVKLRCMESARRDAEEVELTDCKDVGHTFLEFARPLPAHSPVEVTFELGPDGLLKVHGKDLTTGGEIDATFETKSIMPPAEEEAARARNLAIRLS
jgi:molecular chaperone DnaK